MILGGEYFKNITRAKKRAREILNGTVLEKRISSGTQEYEFLSDMAKLNKEAKLKITGEIEYFFVAKFGRYSKRCFFIKCVGAAPEDCGIPACFDNCFTLNLQSLRTAILEQIEAFRRLRTGVNHLSFISDYSGKEFPIEELHIDHEFPIFRDFVTDFFELRKIDIRNKLLTFGVKMEADPVWIDPPLIEEFKEAHRAVKLRLVSRKENLSDLRKTRR